DLAIAVVITHSSLDRLGVYAQLGIPEVWRFDGTALTIDLLSEEGSYAPSATSACLPDLTAVAIVGLVESGRTLPTSQWVRTIRQFVADYLARQPQPGGPDGADGAEQP